jgi:hypothetical protein
MKIYRYGHETNSSSSHSLTLRHGEYILPTKDYKGEPYHITGGMFGWEIETYHDIPTKINYVAVEAMQTGNDELKSLLIELLQEIYNCGEVLFDFNTDWAVDGDMNAYIDHQSYGTVWGEIYCSGGNTKNNLMNFLFNPGGYLSTDNDNH